MSKICNESVCDTEGPHEHCIVCEVILYDIDEENHCIYCVERMKKEGTWKEREE
jgi:hypothetical protein|tara:strand:+ start:963 stop:1124 length:162 start_codon:yes stop_codon:yes gene_type:complete